MNDIGKNLKRIRLLKNLSLKDAGNLLNMSATAISKYEKGKLLLDSKRLIDFASAYNVRSIELLKVYNVPKMKFTSFRKKKRLTGQNLELLEELIQDEVAKYLEVIEMNNIDTSNIQLKKYSCNSLEEAEESANEFRNYIKKEDQYMNKVAVNLTFAAIKMIIKANTIGKVSKSIVKAVTIGTRKYSMSWIKKRMLKTIIELPGNKLFRLGTANNGINALKYTYKAYLLSKKVGKYYKKIKKKK